MIAVDVAATVLAALFSGTAVVKVPEDSSTAGAAVTLAVLCGLVALQVTP